MTKMEFAINTIMEDTEIKINNKKTIRLWTEQEVIDYNEKMLLLKVKLGDDKYKEIMKDIYRAKKYGKTPKKSIEELLEEI